ncbi:MAG: T9SS type A sorting domain-containing protein [Bacteroidales bacterium]|jgi:hypothetical protein|nr:T9SS type A sorting domain-containing protein [Bacteroidales bacterium]
MKTNSYLKTLAVAAMLGAAACVSAQNTLYVSAAGSDTNDGLTLEAALASTAKAVEVAAIGDKIIINGTVTVAATATFAKELTFIGENNAQLKGNGATRLLALEAGANAKFQGITFADGLADGSAGGILIQNSKAEFYSCRFINNKMIGDGDGGAMTIEGTKEETYVKIYNCVFDGNSSERRGGALAVRGPDGDRPVVEIAYSTFQNNTTPEGNGENRGGAFSFFRGEISFYMCDIKNNKAGARVDPESTLDGAGGGAIVCSNDATIYFENSSLYANSATSHGALVFAMGTTTLTFINTSIINNLGNGDGVGLFFQPGDFVSNKFVNVTFAGNTRPGGNDWNFAGVRVHQPAFALDIYNSIFVHNFALGADGGNNGSGDIGFNGQNADQMKQCVIKNSFIGNIHYNGAAQVSAQDNQNIYTLSTLGEYDDRANYLYGEDVSGIYWDADFQHTAANRQGLAQSALSSVSYLTLKSDAETAGLGDPALLEDESGALYDQFGTEREPGEEDGSIFAGAIQSVVGEMEIPAPKTPDPYPLTTGIKQVKPSAEIILPGVVKANGLLQINFGSLSGQAQGVLYNTSGQYVKDLFNRSVLVKDFFPVDGVAPGIYVLKVTIGDKTFAKQLIIQ